MLFSSVEFLRFYDFYDNISSVPEKYRNVVLLGSLILWSRTVLCSVAIFSVCINGISRSFLRLEKGKIARKYFSSGIDF